MNYIVIKQEYRGYLQGQKDRKISVDRLLKKMAKDPCNYDYNCMAWRKGCVVVSHTLIFYFPFVCNINNTKYIAITFYKKKNVQEPFPCFIHLILSLFH